MGSTIVPDREEWFAQGSETRDRIDQDVSLNHMTASLSRALDEPTARELETILELTRSIAAGDSLEAVLDAVADGFRALLPFDRMEYARVDGEGASLKVEWVRSFDAPAVLEPGTDFAYVDASTTSSEPRPYLIYDLPTYAEDKPADHPVCRLAEAGYESSIACPLVVDGRTEAMVFFNTTSPKSWNRRHLALVELIAGHLSIASSRARLTAELRASNDRLTRAQAARAAFIAAVSHEIRSPLTAIVGLTGTLRDDLATLSEAEIAEFVAILDDQAREVTQLADDLLVAARVDAVGMRVNPIPTNVADAITDTVRSLGSRIRLAVSGEPVHALADPLRLRQIVRNLLTNALRHGGPDIRIHHWSDGSLVHIEISDDGQGLPVELESAVFEPFVLGHNAHAESVGLGLSVSKSLALAMGGDLTYQRVGGRTVLRVTLPLA
jgi:signal transduction histidine kinase